MVCPACKTDLSEESRVQLTKRSHDLHRRQMFESSIVSRELALLSTTQDDHKDRIMALREVVSTIQELRHCMATAATVVEPFSKRLATFFRHLLSSEDHWKDTNTRKILSVQGIPVYDNELLPTFQCLIPRLEERKRMYRRTILLRTAVASLKVDASPSFKCHNPECRGFLNKETFRCGLCSWRNCPQCHIPLSDVEEGEGAHPSSSHICDPNEKTSVEFILKTTKPCPNPTCQERIIKRDGCDQMFCVKCYTVFSWKTGLIQNKGVVHNPEYFEMIRRYGREKAHEIGLPLPSDTQPFPELQECANFIDSFLTTIPIGGNRSRHIPYPHEESFLSIFERIFRHSQELHDLRNEAPYNDDTFTNLRISYLANEIDEESMKTQMFERWNLIELEREIYQYMDETVQTITMILYNTHREKLFSPTDTRETIQKSIELLCPMLSTPMERLERMIFMYRQHFREIYATILLYKKQIEYLRKPVCLHEDPDEPLFLQVLHRKAGLWKDGILQEGLVQSGHKRFIGTFHDGKRLADGFAMILSADKSYMGEVKNEEYHGIGKIVVQKQYVYEGHFTNGKMDGTGFISISTTPKRWAIEWSNDVAISVQRACNPEERFIIKDILAHFSTKKYVL